MRLSIDKRDPGYRPDAELKKFKIIFNGVERHDVHTADDELRYVRTVRISQPAPWLPQKVVVSGKVYGNVEILERT